MRSELVVRGFGCREVSGETATRRGILRAIEELRDVSTADDAIVIYYTGHGGRCLVEGNTAEQTSWSYLVPTDHVQGRFRAIADFELSAMVREISAKTPNVTVILDCCYASQMCRSASRGGRWSYGSLVSSRSHGSSYDVSPEISSAAEALLRRRPPKEESSPLVVRVSATSSASFALVAETPRRWGSVFTDLLVRALVRSRTTAPMSWDTIIRWTRERAFAMNGMIQRPDIEGPRQRLPFSLRTAGDMRSRFTIFATPDGLLRIEGGRLHGVARGEVFEVLDGEVVRGTTLEVKEVRADDSVVGIVETKGPLYVEPGKVAARRSPERFASVCLSDESRSVVGLRERIESTPGLVLLEKRPADLEVTLGKNGLQIRDHHRCARATNSVGVTELIEDLGGLARAKALVQALSDPPGLGPDFAGSSEVTIMVRASGAIPRPLVEGETLIEGDEIFVKVRRRDRGRPTFYVNLLEKDVSGRVELVNRSQPSGIPVTAGSTETIGQRAGFPPGLPTGWPSDVDTSILPVGHEELMVVRSRRPLDLRPLLEDFSSAPHTRACGSLATRPRSSLAPLEWDVLRSRFKLAARSLNP